MIMILCELHVLIDAKIPLGIQGCDTYFRTPCRQTGLSQWHLPCIELDPSVTACSFHFQCSYFIGCHYAPNRSCDQNLCQRQRKDHPSLEDGHLHLQFQVGFM
jgi:hypothetical protein